MREDVRAIMAREGIVPSEFFSSEIRSSWQRCLDTGLDPYGVPAHNQISNAELIHRREENDLIRRLAMLEMETLHRQIAGSNFIILFADKDGIILDRIVDGSEETANSRWSRPGFTWQEGINGTNALGMVAMTERPAVVHADEHYFKTYAGLTCAAAPIFGRKGRLTGIIDATSDCRSRQLHTLALVRMSCITIENGLFRERHKGHLILELHSRGEFLGTLQSALLAFDEDGFYKESNGRSRLYLQDLPREKKIHFDEIFRSSFTGFLERLPDAGSTYLADMEGSSFAVRAFNRHPGRRTLKSAPVHGPPGAKGEISMVCEDAVVKSAMYMVRRAVELNVPILIRGETGTGKELMARYAHTVSNRKGNFVAINCAALPETLIESELFGHQSGAFTGAKQGGSKGLVAQAHMGTLFLDEIGVMPAAAQAKLLRFLDRMEIRPVGHTTEVPLDVQIISATNSDLKTPGNHQTFRQDLLYRINTVEICLPPLRKRCDLHEITNAIMETLGHSLKFHEEALGLMESHAWPGNIRELKGLLTRLLISCENRSVRIDDVEQMLSPAGSRADTTPPVKNLADHELSIVRAAYEKCNGNISAVSRELGICRNTVYKKLKEARRLK